MKTTVRLFAVCLIASVPATVWAEDAVDNLTAAYNEDGRYYTEDDVTTLQRMEPSTG